MAMRAEVEVFRLQAEKQERELLVARGEKEACYQVPGLQCRDQEL